MTITLPSEIEQRLLAVASWRGQTTEASLLELLDLALIPVETEIRAALQATEDEFNAGGGITLEEMDARLKAKRSAKRQERQAA